MTIKNLSDSIYIIPVLLDHMKKPSPLTATFLKEYGIEEKDVQVFRKCKRLLEYHHEFIAGGTHSYTLLREGLQQYFNTYLNRLFQKLELTGLKWKVLDYGCGLGQIGLQFHYDNPNSQVYFLDRENENNLDNFYKIDFEEYPRWYKDLGVQVDCVIMSELLHCKNQKWQNYLIKSAHHILKPQGTFIVIENLDYAMAYRIGKLKKKAVNVLTPNDVHKLVKGFKLKKRAAIFQHQIYVYEKV